MKWKSKSILFGELGSGVTNLSQTEIFIFHDIGTEHLLLLKRSYTKLSEVKNKLGTLWPGQ